MSFGAGSPGLTAKLLPRVDPVEALRLLAESGSAERAWPIEAKYLYPIFGGVGRTTSSFCRTRSACCPFGAAPQPETTQIHAPNLDGRRFLGGIVDLTGRLIPAPVSQVVAGRGAGPEELYRTLYFAGFDSSFSKHCLPARMRSVSTCRRLNRQPQAHPAAGS